MNITSSRVRDYMTPSPQTVDSSDEIMRVINRLVEQDISGFPVVNSERKLVGIITERDCIVIGLQGTYFDELGGSVAEYMTSNVRVVHPNDSLMDTAELFANISFRRLPVIENDELVGLISRRDILRALIREAWTKTAKK